jgi:hypothetical protein
MEIVLQKMAVTYRYGEHSNLTTERRTHSQVTTMSGVRGGHHVLDIKHLLSELWNRGSMIFLASAGGQGSVTRHEGMEIWEGNHVDSQLPQIGVELTGEARASSDTRHDDTHEVVKITICWGCELESTEADIVQSLIVNMGGLIRVLNKLVD